MTDKNSPCIVFTDGGARGNPGPAAAGGVIVTADGALIAEVSEYLGVATNNVAEYRALILTLRRALDEGCRSVDIRMDSELVVRQLEGKYRVKDAKMQPLHAAAVKLMAQFDRAHVRHVRRDENTLADTLVNAVLDAREQSMREAKMGL
ncbi:MAG TPA: ribonuclease HI family protein [Candidatus Eremiobacteraceae bacterium]|nr:ribonuclease HI family protein [Candidatus Eremiobacteraceae bacterium]